MTTEEIYFNNSQILFRYIRIWSYRRDNIKSQQTRVVKVLSFISAIILVIISLSDTIEEVRHCENGETISKALYLFALSACTHKFGTAAYAEYEITDCLKKLQALSKTFNNMSYIDKCLRLYKTIFIVGMVCINICSSFFMTAPLTTGKYRPLPFTPNLSFLNNTKTPNWYLIYIYETYAIFVITVSTIAYDTLYCGMMSLCSAIISSICQEIRDIENIIDDHQASEMKMMKTIDKINEIIHLTSRMSDIFSMTTMTHIIYNCNTLALGLYMVSVLPFTDLTCVSMLALICLIVFQLGIYCYFGQEVVNQWEVLQNDLYFTRWYDASKNFKTMLLLTIYISQKDRYIYAGNVVPLSLTTLAVVLKKAYTFFIFLYESR